ncbi:MAG TPA: helix-hairpin-helix domain-containing protein, partial [Longimicrobiales bacterium]
MENVEIAEKLREVADLLEIRGDNPFKVRAYRNAARTVEGLTEPLAEMVRRGVDLEELPAIGKDMAGYISELVRTGHLRRLEQLEKKTPHGAAELVRLEGVGPKKALRLDRELGIRSIADLERALDRGEVERLPGFGKRSAEKLRRAIRDYRKHLERFKLSDADQLVRPLLEYMREAPGLRELEVAGSYRRRVETIGDVDILAAAKPAGPVMERFTAYPEATRVESAGTTRGTIILRNGLHVDLRVVAPESWGAALHYFTGSKAHNIAVRRLGIERGLKINEYGVFGKASGKAAGKGTSKGASRGKAKRAGRGEGGAEWVRVGGRREEEVFRAVGMQFVPPEMREDRGEIEAARRRSLPELVALDDIRGDLQVHTKWSDGRDTLEAMVRAAKERGYAYVAVTDHSPAVRVAGGLDPKRLEKQWKEIDAVARRVKGIAVLKGMEVDILADGKLDLPDEYLDRLDVVIVAVHSRMGIGKTKMTDRVIRGISHPRVHILAHPTGRIINRREPFAVDVDAVLKAAAERDVAIEINAQPDRLDLSDVHAFRARELGVKLAIDTDAHSVGDLRYMRYGVDQARRAWVEKGDV